MIVCSYTGVHFVHVDRQQDSNSFEIVLEDLSYETEQFVNRVLEYD